MSGELPIVTDKSGSLGSDDTDSGEQTVIAVAVQRPWYRRLDGRLTIMCALASIVLVATSMAVMNHVAHNEARQIALQSLQRSGETVVVPAAEVFISRTTTV